MSGAGGMAVSKRLLASFISFTSLWGVIMDIVDRLWLISLVFIFNCYFPSKEQNINIGNAMLSVDEQCALSCQKEGGFRENLFGWFCPLFAPLLLPFELHLCHELTIGAGYHRNMNWGEAAEVFFNFSNHIKVKLEMCGFPEIFDRVSMPNANPQ